jgi:hypothetical protein
MGKINWQNTLVGVGVGGVDEALLYWDEKSGYGGNFKTATDIGRAAMVLLSGLGVTMGYFHKYAEPVLQSSTPLLTKSVVQLIRSKMGMASSVSRMNIPSRRIGTRTRITQTAGPGFENLKPLY